MSTRVNRNGVKSIPAIRCAIYTRKSSEEGLEQDFNSLAALLRGLDPPKCLRHIIPFVLRHGPMLPPAAA